MKGHTSDAPLEVARTEAGLHIHGQAQRLGRALAPWLDARGYRPPIAIRHPLGSGVVRIAMTPLGLGAEHGVLVAGSRRSDFATETESLLLTMGANQKEWQGLTIARGVTLRLEGIAGLGQAVLHESTLHRAVLNLVQNALDAMPQGGTLTLVGQGTPTHVQLQVRDTGGGISAEDLPKIFEPLYTTKPGGTGLGLYIVQEIMTAHRGAVTVESVHGQGTTFNLMLPRVAAVAPAGTPGEDRVCLIKGSAPTSKPCADEICTG